MKKAVFITGGKQYLVSEGETLDVELLKGDQKNLKFNALLVIDGDKISVGQPTVEGAELNVEVLETDIKADKVTAIRYKAKKRVHKVRGHRQHHTKIKISKITV
jgi:large subunit ribosomal protein L21